MSSSPEFDARVGIITAFLDGIGDLDFERVAQCLTDDAVMTLPFLDIPLTNGRAAIVGQLSASVPRMFERMNFFYDAWYDAGPDTVIAEYHSVCPLKDRPGEYRNSYITVFGFRGNQIGLYKEYLNPTRMA